MEKYNELKLLVDSMKEDFQKFYAKDNHAAGTRIRMKMQQIKVLAQEIRIQVQSVKKENTI